MSDNPDPTPAASLLDVPVAELSRFEDAPDLFNPPNTLSGWLCRRGDHRYGALVIESVNGQADRHKHPYVVYGTPKQRYPFGRTEDEERRYHWPTAVRQAVAWEKLDGTNILGYCYPHRGAWFVTYKTRLTPTLRSKSAHGDFFARWSEVLTPEINMNITPLLALSFELLGHRNHHLVSYEEPLAATLLFAVDQYRAAIVPPEAFSDTGLRLPELVARAEARTDLTVFYEKLRAECQAKNKALDDEHMEGTEGVVVYIEDEQLTWTQWKAKPESIEALHWASDYLPMSVILPTAWNALESCDELTPEVVTKLLAEEFSAAMIRNSTARIEKAVARVKDRLAWHGKVSKAYGDCGKTFEDDGKGDVMRAMAPAFERSKMREVFNALRELGYAQP